MRVTRALPFLSLCERFLPARLAGLSMALLKATALELVILTGHVLLYPSGVLQERRRPLHPDHRHHPSHSAHRDHSDHRDRPDHLGSDATRLPTEAKRPVVLLHGFIDNRSVFVLLRRSLAQHGRQQIESLNYSPLICDIRAAAELLRRRIEELCERTGQHEVDIVGHSLGGLIARYYAQRLGGDTRVHTLVTLGTPHGGTSVVPMANAHPIVRQMRPGSDVIEELRLPAPDCRTRFVSFWSELDHLMDPLETACVEHPDLLVQNVRVTGIGHLALPVHPAVATGVRQALDAEEWGAEGAAQGRAGGLTVA